jgi:predicted Fe-Mo cluster-binding NifX family protein
MNVAVPKLREKIAPCFEAARQFDIFQIENNKIINSKNILCESEEGFRRIRLMRLHDINILICNGIKTFYSDQLSAMGIIVISNIIDSGQNAIKSFLSGKISGINVKQKIGDDFESISHKDLVSWTKELFENNGYKVTSGPLDSILIDFIAETNCPICQKKISVAICCAAHTYRTDLEIKEFHHCTGSRYDASVYIHPDNAQVEKQCVEYGMEFISPDSDFYKSPEKNKNKISLLRQPIKGHERAFEPNK